ncbi:MAG: peptide chain release factor N(5)-glutamine methyltransferase, partial [Nitrospinales bacterium]
EFWSMEFKVTPAVLIPRPETEILIERFLETARKENDTKQMRVLDVGTGSGNIAVVAAKERPLCRVTALDISTSALTIARENARRYGVLNRIQFVESDLWENLTAEVENNFDFILSNPPYIDPLQFPDLMRDVRDYEPRQALLGGSEGLEFYRRLVPGACARLRPGGYLFMEIGLDQAEQVTRIIQTHGRFETPVVHQDYSGRDRVVSARKSNDG